MSTVHRWSRTLLLAAALLIISAILATPMAALTWEAPVPVTGSGAAAWRGALVATGGDDAAAISREAVSGGNAIRVRRSLDGGGSWESPVRLSADGTKVGRASLASAGQSVDAVWSEGQDCFYGPCELRYARSLDGGATFQAAMRLSKGDSFAGQGSVVRSGSRVVVAWTDVPSGLILVRVSNDGGTSFRASATLGTSRYRYYEAGGREGFPMAAVRGGVILVAFHTSARVLVVRRSTDGGKSWRPAQVLATNATATVVPSMALGGQSAVIAYGRVTRGITWIAYRRTTDLGVSWKSADVLAAKTAMPASDPVLSYGSGAYQAAFFRCADAACREQTGGSGGSFLRTSASSGRTWSAAAAVTDADPAAWAVPAGIAAVDGTLLLYSELDTQTFEARIMSRHGG
jgi:hypothetical protein